MQHRSSTVKSYRFTSHHQVNGSGHRLILDGGASRDYNAMARAAPFAAIRHGMAEEQQTHISKPHMTGQQAFLAREVCKVSFHGRVPTCFKSTYRQSRAAEASAIRCRPAPRLKAGPRKWPHNSTTDVVINLLNRRQETWSKSSATSILEDYATTSDPSGPPVTCHMT